MMKCHVVDCDHETDNACGVCGSCMDKIADELPKEWARQFQQRVKDGKHEYGHDITEDFAAAMIEEEVLERQQIANECFAALDRN